VTVCDIGDIAAATRKRVPFLVLQSVAVCCVAQPPFQLRNPFFVFQTVPKCSTTSKHLLKTGQNRTIPDTALIFAPESSAGGSNNIFSWCDIPGHFATLRDPPSAAAAHLGRRHPSQYCEEPKTLLLLPFFSKNFATG
jgi:hypothetical protein